MRGVVVVGLLFILASCAEKNKILTGNWEYDHSRDFKGKTINSYPYYDILIFISDSLVDTKRQYHPVEYQLKSDSLFIYDPNETPVRPLLVNQTKDSLVLRDSLQEHVYKRFDYPQDKPHQLDQIVLTTTGCFGRCPIINVSISSNGDVIYYGERFVSDIGYFTAKLHPGKFEEIEKHFGWANYDTLSQYYTKRITDSETISTTFIKGNEIVNSVEDYAHSSGNRYLNWAYSDLVHLAEQLDLTRLDSTKIPFHYSLSTVEFTTDTEAWRLKKSETFLLWNYLLKADTVNAIPGPKQYDLNYYSNLDNRSVTIKTDGRLFRIPNGKVLFTLDIGFNFLDQNPKFVHFARTEN
jgi:hypothetical protein